MNYYKILAIIAIIIGIISISLGIMDVCGIFSWEGMSAHLGIIKEVTYTPRGKIIMNSFYIGFGILIFYLGIDLLRKIKE